MPYKPLPRQSLGFFPTLLTPLPRLTQRLGGPRLFMKRDDQTGLALGGNKVRKLEFLVGEALAQGCDTLVTGGAAQSNHCRQTAAAAAACGLSCHLVLGGEAPDLPEGNLLLDQLCGAVIHWTGEFRKGEKIPDIAESLRAAGRRPYVVPYGGSNTTGAVGFVEAVRELADQLVHRNESITHVVFASSSGGTQAGLTVGKRLFGLDGKLIGIGIDKGVSGDVPFAEHVLELANATAARLGVPEHFSAADVTIREDYTGEGYGVVGELERRAIRMVAQTEGILLDPVYTGRAMGGLIDMVERGDLSAADSVLFWHTGGTPALFPYARDLVER
ncbi:MAG: D-cysteine desulfhydrase family protein [Planctomycetes bacterium]|jgi:D-cysteine desulfhydrase|nr:D-cysteine desulfhydrase family protein [Planctomycetota bacterium]